MAFWPLILPESIFARLAITLMMRVFPVELRATRRLISLKETSSNRHSFMVPGNSVNFKCVNFIICPAWVSIPAARDSFDRCRVPILLDQGLPGKSGVPLRISVLLIISRSAHEDGPEKETDGIEGRKGD